ncbi:MULTISPECIES: ATP-binding protein [Thiorhodovibrio]|uniref:ATP-binding protein n=1 Tax=Thiorhodovibrio TaxID=61593 RepID=UPI0019133903|nr:MULTISPECIES: ATP-binding protein [Thiorhodovibrio]MBK5967925.1 ATP-binding protein [Thiorhodovibrio winogradskyi]WPL13126.1 chromosome segregation protein SMC [Thiorhodovibrio litoralis]
MPSLNRIILINTHLQGVVELVVDAHTNICGTNASGKTTLQRLVPVFYGEYPSRVVPSTRDSFERWYLPTEQSFIIYEYQRMDGQACQAVLAASADGKGVAYRLVQKAFDLADYTRSRHGDTLSCFGMAELGRRLKQAEVSATRLLNTREYRAILQNDRVQLAAGASSGELRAFAREFSLCEPGHALRHIEKLAQAVHSREGKMETVRSMIAAILEEDGVSPPTSGLKLQRVDDWMRESRLIQGFDAMRPEFEQLEREYQDLLACERRLSGLRLGYRSDEPRQQRLIEEADAAIAQMESALNQLEERWTQQRDDLNQQRSASKGEITRDEGELEQIEQQYQSFLEADIEQARIDLEAVGTWREDLENLRGRYRLLTDQHQDVERDYLERGQRIKDQRERQLDELREQQTVLQDQRTDQLERQTAELSALQQRQQAEMETGQEDFRERDVQLGLDRQRLETQIESASYTEDERQSLAIFDRRREQAEADSDSADAEVRRLEGREQQQLRQRNEADAALRAARRQVDGRQRELDAVQRLLFPGQHSLLEFLRREQPDWETRLGKLIDPALLQRSDLKPALAEPAQDAAFGLRLDLAAIDTPEHAASEQTLRQRLQLAEDAKKDADNQQQAAERQLGEHSEALETLQPELTVARTERDNRRDDLRRIREEHSTEQSRINEALSERKRKDRKALTDLMTRIQQLASEREQWREDIQSRHTEVAMELKAHWQQVIGRIDSEIQRLRTAIDERKQQAQTELDACEQWYQGELKSRGVDEQAIMTLKQQISQLDERIERTERRRPEVLRYDDWYQRSWLKRKPALQQALEDSRRRAAELDQELNAATSAFKTERGRLEAERAQAKLRKDEAQEQLNRLKILLRRMGELRLSGDGAPPDGALDERLRQGEKQLYVREQALDAVKVLVEHFDTLIASNAGSSLAEFWERSRADCMLVGEREIPALDHRKLVPHLEQLLKVLLPQSLTALREQGRLFGIDLNSYYDVLADIDQRIATQSARITREVAEDLSLDGVSDSAVRIRSRITELEFWPELKAFIHAFREWRDEDFSGLPDEDYVSSMRRALDIIGRSAQSGGVAGLLEIELRLREGQSDLVIRTDRQLNESSSHGMAYMILCKFLLAFTRLLRGRAPVTIHWPIDELGTLHNHNVKKIFDACAANDIRVLGAFPNPDSEILGLFANRYIVDKQTRQLQIVKPRIDAIAAKLRQRGAGDRGEVASKPDHAAGAYPEEGL